MHSEPSLLGVLRAKMRGAASSKAKLRGASENYSTASRTILTQHIIKMARDGERDPRWLADSALLYLSQQTHQHPGPKIFDRTCQLRTSRLVNSF